MYYIIRHIFRKASTQVFNVAYAGTSPDNSLPRFLNLSQNTPYVSCIPSFLPSCLILLANMSTVSTIDLGGAPKRSPFLYINLSATALLNCSNVIVS